MISQHRCASLMRGFIAFIAFVAVILGVAATAALAAGDTAGIQTGFSTPIMANEEPAPPGVGPNPGDAALSKMQNDPRAFEQLGKRYPPAPGAANADGVDASAAQMQGRAGWNPALVHLQAKSVPFPWEQAAADSKGVSTKTASAPATRPR